MAALAMSGCAQTQQVADWLASDRARAAAVNLGTAAAAILAGAKEQGL